VVGHLLLRGLLAGVVAGLLAFGFAKAFGEPTVERAIAFEAQMDKMKGEMHMGGMHMGEMDEPELVSRATQAGLGLFVAVVVYGAAVGGLFSLVFAYVQGRVSSLRPRTTAALLALAAFVGLVLIPGLKYPANPPAVGDPETIGSRTALFFAMLVISVVVLSFAVRLAKSFTRRYGAWNAGLIGAAAYVLIVAIAGYLLPEVNEVPEHFSAVVLWNFRMASLGLQVVLWTTIGIVFGLLAERAVAHESRRQIHRPTGL
jgi:hypothetical protein